MPTTLYFDLPQVDRILTDAEQQPEHRHNDSVLSCHGVLLLASDRSGVHLRPCTAPTAGSADTAVYAHGWHVGGAHHLSDTPFGGGMTVPVTFHSPAAQPLSRFLSRTRTPHSRWLYVICDDAFGQWQLGVDDAMDEHPGAIPPHQQQQRRRQLLKQTKAAVSDGRTQIMCIFPRSDNGFVFAYTVGLTAIGAPELLIVGMDPHTARAILGHLAADVRHSGRRLSNGEVLSDVLEDYNAVIVQAEPGHAHPEMPPSTAWNVFGRDMVSLQQVVWPDQDHRYPWDDGFALTKFQPVIASPADKHS